MCLMFLAVVLNLAKGKHSIGCGWERDHGNKSGKKKNKPKWEKDWKVLNGCLNLDFYWKSLSRFLRDPAELGASRCHCKSEMLDESGSQNISAFMITWSTFLVPQATLTLN